MTGRVYAKEHLWYGRAGEKVWKCWSSKSKSRANGLNFEVFEEDLLSLNRESSKSIRE